MPAPWLMARPSGFYCRVFVPADLRPIVGQRFLVRALRARDRDEARLIAAQWAVTVAALYKQLRRELTLPEPKVSDVLAAMQSGGTRDFTVKHYGPGGNLVAEVIIENERDAKLAKKHAPHLLEPPPALAAPAMPTKYRLRADHGVPVSARVDLYEQQLTKKNRTSKYINESKAIIAILIDIVGDMPPDDYEPLVIDKFMARLEFLPPNPEKDKLRRDHWAKRTHTQRSHEVELLDLPKISSTTVNKHVSRLSAFFTFCKLRGYMAGSNPMEGRSASPDLTKGDSETAKAQREGFTEADLEAIFDPQRYRTRKLPHTFWPPLIALMTGARCNEIAQLYLDDIVDDDPEHPGQWRMMVLPKRPDQRVKNETSIRSIPLHPKLIELGFLVYLADLRRLGFDRVFPTLLYTKAAGYGDSVSEFFSGYLREKVGITAPTKVFHSFRYYFCNFMFRKSKQERMHVVGMTGHAREGVFERTYAGELHYTEKMALLMKLKLPTLGIEPYKAGDFDKYFKSTERNRAAAARREAAKQVAEALPDTSARSV